MKKINIIIFCFFISFIHYVHADVEEEIYSPEFDNKIDSSKNKNFDDQYNNVNFKKLITCIFKKSEYKRIFRFGITNDNKFFYRQPINLNIKMDGYATEKLFLTKKNNTYVLKISKGDEELDLEINFDEKKSNLSKNFILVSKVNCR